MKIDQVLKAVSPNADAAFVAASVSCDAGAIMARYGLTGATEQAQLLGQLAAECGGFKTFAENLDYSAKRLHEVWPKRYPNEGAAAPYAHNPKALAVNVYGGRGGNRPSTSDGWDYRGSGGLQHTFRPEFDRVTKRTGFDVLTKPDLLRNKANASLIWHAACSYFADRGAIPAARLGDTRAVTLKVNGGTNGLADRTTYVARAVRAMGGLPVSSSGAAPSPTLPPVPQPSPEAADRPTVVEEAEDAKSKRDKAIAGATVGTATSGGVATGGEVPKTNTHWVFVGAIVLVTAVLLGAVVMIFWRRHKEAAEVLETVQLAGVRQRAEGAPP